MMKSADIRWAHKKDYTQLGHVMFDAVHNGPSLYREAQKTAWVPVPRSGKDWEDRLGTQAVILAESSDQITGFMSLAPKGYIGFAYIRPSAQGSGLFKRLYKEIEQRAIEEGIERLWVHASLMAQPAFAAVGFAIIEEQTIDVLGQSIERYEMQKLLGER